MYDGRERKQAGTVKAGRRHLHHLPNALRTIAWQFRVNTFKQYHILLRGRLTSLPAKNERSTRTNATSWDAISATQSTSVGGVDGSLANTPPFGVVATKCILRVS